MYLICDNMYQNVIISDPEFINQMSKGARPAFVNPVVDDRLTG